MIISSDLFDLIRSLSKTEKIYFKKNSKAFIRGEGNNYLELFDAIAAQESYNEKKLLDRFRKEKFARQFSVAKNYLYNRILETMHSYHRSVMSEVHGLMDRSEYLFDKGLYAQADKQLRMAEKLAQKHELHSTLITIREHHRFDQSFKKREPALAEKNIEHAQDEVLLLNNHMNYLHLLAQAQDAYNRFGKRRNKKYLAEFRNIMQHPLLKNESRALTFNGKKQFYDIHSVYNSILGKEEKAYHFSQKVISLFDQNPEKKKHSALQYAGYINNTLLYCHFLSRHRESEALLEKLSELKPAMTGKYRKARLFEIYTNNFLNLYNTTGRFGEAQKKLEEFIAELQEHEKQLADRDRLLLYGNIAGTFFGLGNYKSSLAWINKLRNEVPANIRPDLESEMALLNIIVHYELGHHDLIPHLVASYYRFLKTKELITKPEKYLLAYFRKAAAANTPEKLTARMTELRDQLAGYMNKKKQTSAYAPPFFDIVSWLESKIEKRPFGEILRNKMNKHP